MTILLYPGRSKASQPVIGDRGLPGQELFHRQSIALASLLKTKKTTAHSGNHLSLAANNPTPRIRGWKIGDGQWAAIRADYIFYSRSNKIGHCTLYTKLQDLSELTLHTGL
ncbi:hypothetical protein BLM14_03635 [Phyllobacterium zundukense]|nr:hypothetical protein BLM14_03635 [Phyllobacterium zundukense]